MSDLLYTKKYCMSDMLYTFQNDII